MLTKSKKTLSLLLAVCFSSTILAAPVLANPGRGGSRQSQNSSRSVSQRSDKDEQKKPAANNSNRKSDNNNQSNKQKQAGRSTQQKSGQNTVKKSDRNSQNNTNKKTETNKQKPVTDKQSAKNDNKNTGQKNDQKQNVPNGHSDQKQNNNSKQPNNDRDKNPVQNNNPKQPAKNEQKRPEQNHQNNPPRNFPRDDRRDNVVIKVVNVNRVYFERARHNHLTLRDFIIAMYIAKQLGLEDYMPIYLMMKNGSSYRSICRTHNIKWRTVRRHVNSQYEIMSADSVKLGLAIWSLDDVLN